MIPGPDKIIVCPHCGGTKAVRSLISGNTFRGMYWSDGSSLFPMLPRNSSVQKCPHCGAYFFLAHCKEATDTGNKKDPFQNYHADGGDLTFQEWREAYESLSQDPLDETDNLNLHLGFIFAYNKELNLDDSQNVPSDEERQLFQKIVGQTLLLIEGKILAPWMKADLLREVGEFDECVKTVDEIKTDDNFVKSALQDIRKRAIAKNSKVFNLKEY